MLAMPDPNSFELLPWAEGDDPVGPHVLRHPQPRRHAVRGRPPPGAASATSTRPASRASRSTSPPRWSSSTSATATRRTPPKLLDTGSYFDLTTADVASDLRKRTIHMLEAMGIPVEYSLPRGRAQPARDRPALHRRADDGRQRHDLPPGRARDRPRAGRLRHVHAQAARRACRARACTPTCRCSRATTTPSTSPATPTACRRWPSGFIAGLLRHAPEITAVTNQLVNSYKRLDRRASRRRCYVTLGPQQPLGAGAGAGHQGGQAVVDPHRVPLPRSGLQPLPRLLGDPGRRPAGHRRGLRAAARGRRPTCSSSPPRSGPPRASSRCRSRCREALDVMEQLRAGAPRRSASTSSSGSCATSAASGSTTRPRSRQFELDRYLPNW